MKRKVETLLLNWKKRPDGERKPLLLNGARQVGKTYILRKFGEEQFSNVVYVNLEANLTVASFFGENISPERLIRYLESASGEKIVPGKTKTRYSLNLNPLRPFTLVNKKEKILKNDRVETKDKFICNKCGLIFD